MTNGVIRSACPADVPEILDLIADAAEYERAPEQAVATREQLEGALFSDSKSRTGSPALFCHVVEHAGPGTSLGGSAVWFLNYSTWSGEHGIYLEDLYVRPELRGLGYGYRLMVELAGICMERGYSRLDWAVLDWNQPAIDFYRRIGGEPLSEWLGYRLTGAPLEELSQRK